MLRESIRCTALVSAFGAACNVMTFCGTSDFVFPTTAGSSPPTPCPQPGWDGSTFGRVPWRSPSSCWNGTAAPPAASADALRGLAASPVALLTGSEVSIEGVRPPSVALPWRFRGGRFQGGPGWGPIIL
eukprot:gene17681-biopygen11099